MTIKIQCPHCAQRISASDDVVGTVVECPTCNATFEAAALDSTAPAAPAAVSAVRAHPGSARSRPAARPQSAPPRNTRGRTAIVIGCALAVVAGGLSWWYTVGPGTLHGVGSPTASEKRSLAVPTQHAPAANTAGSPSPDGIPTADLQGVWRGKIPRTVVAKPYDLAVTITYNERGEGFPKFEPPDGDKAAFKEAWLATLFRSGGKDKVILLREWEVSLAPDKKTMTWTEVNGPAKVKFMKE
jgi:hypothetical protein